MEFKCDIARTFVTADCHFASWAFMLGPWKVFSQAEEEEIIVNWNATVKPEDLVFYVGDFCDGGLAELMSYRQRLNGKIILVKGNHDKFSDEIYRAVFDGVCEEMTLEDEKLLIKHWPEENLRPDFRQIHAHLHEGAEGAWNMELDPKRYFSASVMHNGLRPVLLAEAIRKMQS